MTLTEQILAMLPPVYTDVGEDWEMEDKLINDGFNSYRRQVIALLPKIIEAVRKDERKRMLQEIE